MAGILSIDFSQTLNILIFLTLTSPLVAVASRRAPRAVEVYAIVGLAAALASSLIQAASTPVVILFSNPPESSAQIFVDSLSSYMAVIYIFVGLLSALFSVGYIEERKRGFYPLLLAMITGLVGVVFSGDLASFFVFWELMSLTAYVLVAFFYDRWEAVEASFKYLIMSSAGTASILLSFSLLYGITGTLSIPAIAEALRNEMLAGNSWTYVALALLIAGLGVNAAMAPFHSWLPDAHPAAPSPISAMLSGVVIKTGIYGMFRFLSGFFPPQLYNWQLGLLLFAALTMTVGNVMALLQDDIKRLLAFSSIAHIGYIVLGLGVATLQGFTGGILHILNHASMKALLFLAAGAFIHSVNTRSLEELSGIGRRMPITGVAFSIGAFSLAGLPGLNAFVSEFQIIASAVDAGLIVFAVIMILNVLLGASYYLRVIQIIFLKPMTSVSEKAHEAPIVMLIPLIILSILAVVIGVQPDPFLSIAREIAETLLP